MEKSEIKCDDNKKVTPILNLAEIAKGNKHNLPVFKEMSASRPVATSNSIAEKSSEKSPSSDSAESVDDTTSQNGENITKASELVLYKGGLIDIEKLLEQMKRSEKAREETEKMLVELRKTNGELAASHTKAKDKIKDLQSDVKSYTRKLGDAEQNLSSTNVSLEYYYRI